MILWSGFGCLLINTNAKVAVLDGLNHSEQIGFLLLMNMK